MPILVGIGFAVTSLAFGTAWWMDKHGWNDRPAKPLQFKRGRDKSAEAPEAAPEAPIDGESEDETAGDDSADDETR